MSVHIYCRVSSTNGKFNCGTNIDHQIDECVEFSRKLGYDNPIVHTHAKSGRNKKNISKLFDILETMNENDLLMIYSVDRLSRNVLEGINFLDKLTEKNCKIITVQDGLTYDPNNIHHRFRFRDLLNHAELESDRASQRIRSAINRKKGISSTKFQCAKIKQKKISKTNNYGITKAKNKTNIENNYFLKRSLQKYELNVNL